MRELYRLEHQVAYRLGCECNNHEHVLDIEVNTENGEILCIGFQEHICTRTRNLLWRINTALRILLGKELCFREVIVESEEINEFVKVLQGEITG